MRKSLLAASAMALIGYGGAAHAGDMATTGTMKPEPGKAAVHLDVAFEFIAGVGSDTTNKAGGNKTQQYGFDGLLRFYPSFDAMTAGGIKYGAAGEIRSNSAGATPSAGASARSTAQTLYIRRAYGYIGSDTMGTFKFGQIDGPMSALKTGDFLMVGDGGLDGDVPNYVQSIGGAWQFPFGVGNEYAISKVIYLSPTFGGFDIGVSFAPSNQPLLGGIQAAAPGGVQTITSTAPDSRPINIFEINSRYRGTFGGVGVAVNLGYMGSGHVSDGTGTKGLSVIDAGAQVSFAGFTAGGHLSTGKFNGTTFLAGKGDKDAMLYLLGLDYANGPLNIGAQYVHNNRPGVVGNGVSQITDAVALGATYNWAPGANLVAEFMTGSVKEGATKGNGTGFIVAQYFRW